MKIKLPWTKERLVFPIVRVDDRLLHGQVIIGWGQMLGLRPVLLASDRVVKETSLAETFREILPPELEGGVVTLAEAAERWERGDFKEQHALIVVEAPVDALKLLNRGAPMKMLTLGGLHYREDRDEREGGGGRGPRAEHQATYGFLAGAVFPAGSGATLGAAWGAAWGPALPAPAAGWPVRSARPS